MNDFTSGRYETLATLTVHRPLTPADIDWLEETLLMKLCEFRKGEASAIVCDLRKPLTDASTSR